MTKQWVIDAENERKKKQLLCDAANKANGIKERKPSAVPPKVFTAGPRPGRRRKPRMLPKVIPSRLGNMFKQRKQ